MLPRSKACLTLLLLHSLGCAVTRIAASAAGLSSLTTGEAWQEGTSPTEPYILRQPEKGKEEKNSYENMHGLTSRKLLTLPLGQHMSQRIPTRGREVKRVKEHARRKEIPDVTLASVHDLWDEKDRRSLLATEVIDSMRADKLLALPLNQQIYGRDVQYAAQLADEQGAQQPHITAASEGVQHSMRQMMGSHQQSRGKRELSSERPNGVSEMPDPEAAEYLSKHQSKDLGSDVMNAAKLHYNGVQEGSVHPLSTDRHATTEEHVTQGMNEASLHSHMQQSEAVSNRYASFQHGDEPSVADKKTSKETKPALQAKPVSPPAKQKGYPWYAEYPDASFPHANLTKTNRTIYNELMELKRQQQLLSTESKSPPQTVADITRDALATEKQLQASIWSRSSPRGPGDGGELPPGSYIFATTGGADVTPARKTRDELSQMRAEARVWMSSQEVNLIESFLHADAVMLEFGSGYSTMWFSQFVKEYYSIEHNATWFDEMKTQINSTRKNVHLQVAPVERGYKGWGGGFEEGTYAQFERYILAVDNFKVTSFDRVLIDGRARAACAEYILKYLHPDSLIFIHDYQDRYFYHGTAEQYYTKVAQTYDGQSLVVLRPKPEALMQAAKAAVASLAST